MRSRMSNLVHVLKRNSYGKIWLNISKLDAFFSVSGDRREQKWKNITKEYRGTIDHNNKSGNGHKECRFYN